MSQEVSTEQRLSAAWQLKYGEEDEQLLGPALAKLYDRTTSEQYHDEWLRVIFDTCGEVEKGAHGVDKNIPEDIPGRITPVGGYARLSNSVWAMTSLKQ